MGKISLIQDYQRTYQGQFDVLIGKISDYVDGYNTILSSIYKNSNLVVVVRNKYCMNWLMKMQQQYHESRIEVSVYSPKKRFEELSGAITPDYINDDDISKDELILKMDKFVFSNSLSFEDNILNHYMGAYFTQEYFPFLKLVEILENLDFEFLSSIKKYRVLSKVYKNRLKRWNENCTNDYQRVVLSEFIDGSKELFKALSKYSILSGYPIKLQNEIIGDLAKAFNKLNLHTTTFILEDIDIVVIKNNIRLFLNSLELENLKDNEIEENIEMLSGHLSEELQFVHNLLDANRPQINKSIIDKVRKKFEDSSLFDSDFEEYITNFISPNYVENPEGNNDINDWINWATSSYLPYKFWLEETNTFDPVVDSFSQQYADWVFKNYDSLISGEPKMIFRTIKNISSNLKTDNTSIILMLDNFNYKYVNYCKKLFEDRGYALTINAPVLSMLPTATEVSKYAFFSGEPFNDSDKQYSSMCQELGSMLLKEIKYLPDLNSMDSIVARNADIYILNYLSLDKVLHDNIKDSAIPLKQRIRAELDAMVNKVMTFIYRLGVENTIKIYVISDHGSTKIIDGQDNLIPPKFHKDKSEDAGYRYITLDDNKFETYKDSLGNLCYSMGKAEYGVKYNYMIAKSYNRFLKTNEFSYVHGGISPEEHIVPLLKFEKIRVALNKPSVSLKTNEFRFNTLANFVLEIKNFNDYQIVNLNITILNDNIKGKYDEFYVGDVGSFTSKEYAIRDARILNNKEPKQYLRIKMDYEFAGKKYSDNIELELRMKSIQEKKVDLDDLF